MAIKQGDFVELNYTGRVSDGAFDTTQEAVAKAEGIYSQKTTYKPVIIVVGERHVIPGLDKELVGKDVGKYTFEIKDVDAFGKKDAKKMQLVPMKVFAQENIKPFAGLQVNFDNQIGTVRSVSGGRVIVDFNHPLSSKDVTYDVEVKRIVSDKKEQVQAFFDIIGLPVDNIEVTGEKATVGMKQPMPEQFTKPLTDDVKRLTGVDVSFDMPKMPEPKKEN